MQTVSKEKLFEIAGKFQLKGKILEVCPYGSGHINDTFRMILEKEGIQKAYILQRMNGEIFKNRDELMDNIMRVTRFIKKKVIAQGGDPDRETLQIIPTWEEEAYYKEADGDGWRVYPFIENTVSYDLAENAEDFNRSGYAFGNFQYLLADFPAEELHETIVNFHNTADRFEKFRKAVEADVMGRAGDVQEEIRFLMDREQDCYFFGNLLDKKELPLRVTHNDTKLNNVLFDRESGRAICVIDLDTVMPGFAAHDFGDAIRFGASTAAEDEKDLDQVTCSMELFKAYFDGFMEGCRGSLTQKEVETLPMGAKIMTLECGMRFLTDYLEGDLYFKTHYEGQNLDRTRTQLKLVKDMEDKWEIMENIVKYLI